LSSQPWPHRGRESAQLRELLVRRNLKSGRVQCTERSKILYLMMFWRVFRLRKRLRKERSTNSGESLRRARWALGGHGNGRPTSVRKSSKTQMIPMQILCSISQRSQAIKSQATSSRLQDTRLEKYRPPRC